MPAPSTPRIRARLAGPSGLAAALVLGAAGPASGVGPPGGRLRSGHRLGAGGGGRLDPVTTTDSSLGAIAVLGACGLAGFLLLILGGESDVDEPAEAAPKPPDLEAILRAGGPVRAVAADRAGQLGWAAAATRRRAARASMADRRRSGSSD